MTRLPDKLIQGKLRPDLFNELLNRHLSTRIAYARADLCPCSSERGSGNADPRCPLCHGIGYTWSQPTPALQQTRTFTRAPVAGHEDMERLTTLEVNITKIVDEDGVEYPVDSVRILPDGTIQWVSTLKPANFKRYTMTMSGVALRAGIQNVMSRREYQVRGEYDVLDLQASIDRHLDDRITLNPAWDCGESDRFTMLDGWRRHAQKVRKGATGPDGDLVLYRDMQNIQVSSLQGNRRYIWTEGTDYQFVDGRIVWQTNTGPRRGETYAIQAEVRPEYYVFKALPRIRHEDNIDLPRIIILKDFEQFPNRRPDEPI